MNQNTVSKLVEMIKATEANLDATPLLNIDLPQEDYGPQVLEAREVDGVFVTAQDPVQPEDLFNRAVDNLYNYLTQHPLTIQISTEYKHTDVNQKDYYIVSLSSPQLEKDTLFDVLIFLTEMYQWNNEIEGIDLIKSKKELFTPYEKPRVRFSRHNELLPKDQHTSAGSNWQNADIIHTLSSMYTYTDEKIYNFKTGENVFGKLIEKQSATASVHSVLGVAAFLKQHDITLNVEYCNK